MQPGDEVVVDVLGRPCRVRGTLGDYLLAREALSDPWLDGEERFGVLVHLAFADPRDAAETFGEGLREALSEALWEAFGIDVDGDRWVDGERALDWEADREMMTVTARSAYGLSWAGLCALPYREALALMSMAPRESPMGQAIYYRLAEEPARTKYNGEAVEAFRRMRERYRLKGE